MRQRPSKHYSSDAPESGRDDHTRPMLRGVGQEFVFRKRQVGRLPYRQSIQWPPDF
jgi:hypothetical protein